MYNTQLLCIKLEIISFIVVDAHYETMIKLEGMTTILKYSLVE